MGVNWFPSPYRGYHLSTQKMYAHLGGTLRVSVPLSGLSSFNTYRWKRPISTRMFPSPYRGYHLSTLVEPSWDLLVVFLLVSVPLSGLSSFNVRDTVNYLEEKKVSFRPLIGVIIFQPASNLSSLKVI